MLSTHYTIKLTEHELTLVKKSLLATTFRLIAKLGNRQPDAAVQQRLQELNDLLDHLPHF